MRVTKEVADVLNATFEAAARERYEFATPELLLLVQTAHEIQAAVRRMKIYVVSFGSGLKKQNVGQGNVAGFITRS